MSAEAVTPLSKHLHLGSKYKDGKWNYNRISGELGCLDAALAFHSVHGGAPAI